MRTPTTHQRQALAIAPLRRQLRRLVETEPGEPAPTAVLRRVRAASALAEILEPLLVVRGVSAEERAEIALSLAELEILAEERRWDEMRRGADELELRLAEVERSFARPRRGRAAARWLRHPRG